MSLELPGSGFVYAPVACGQSAGYAHVLLDGKAVGKVPVYYGETVEQTPQKQLSIWQRLFS